MASMEKQNPRPLIRVEELPLEMSRSIDVLLWQTLTGGIYEHTTDHDSQKTLSKRIPSKLSMIRVTDTLLPPDGLIIAGPERYIAGLTYIRGVQDGIYPFERSAYQGDFRYYIAQANPHLHEDGARIVMDRYGFIQSQSVAVVSMESVTPFSEGQKRVYGSADSTVTPLTRTLCDNPISEPLLVNTKRLTALIALAGATGFVDTHAISGIRMIPSQTMVVFK
jgi:hypothetical protein